MSVAPPEGGRNRIMIYGPKPDGTYIVEFKTADGEALGSDVLVHMSLDAPGAPSNLTARLTASTPVRAPNQRPPSRRGEWPSGRRPSAGLARARQLTP